MVLRPDFILANTHRLQAPHLCVVIDTEEDFDWRAPFSRQNILVGSIAAIDRGQTIFQRFGLRPTYLVDYPVASDERARDVLGSWARTDSCLIGAQLHPWVTPPFEEVVCPFNTFPCNLPPDLEYRKLQVLCTTIEEGFRCTSRVYKAGRYGIDVSREATLREMGFEVDTSVVPFRSYAGAGGGPDFFGYPDRPFWSSTDRSFLYLPVSQHVIGPLSGIARAGLARLMLGPRADRKRLPGILSRLRLVQRVMLTPEGVPLHEMCKVVCVLIEAGYRVFSLSLHSPSFMPGKTPYTRSARDLEEMLAKIERFLEFFFGEVHGLPTTPLELKRLLGAGPSR